MIVFGPEELTVRTATSGSRTHVDRPGGGGACRGKGRTAGSAAEADWHGTGCSFHSETGRVGTGSMHQSGSLERAAHSPCSAECEA